MVSEHWLTDPLHSRNSRASTALPHDTDYGSILFRSNVGPPVLAGSALPH